MATVKDGVVDWKFVSISTSVSSRGEKIQFARCHWTRSCEAIYRKCSDGITVSWLPSTRFCYAISSGHHVIGIHSTYAHRTLAISYRILTVVSDGNARETSKVQKVSPRQTDVEHWKRSIQQTWHTLVGRDVYLATVAKVYLAQLRHFYRISREFRTISHTAVSKASNQDFYLLSFLR